MPPLLLPDDDPEDDPDDEPLLDEIPPLEEPLLEALPPEEEPLDEPLLPLPLPLDTPLPPDGVDEPLEHATASAATAPRGTKKVVVRTIIFRSGVPQAR